MPSTNPIRTAIVAYEGVSLLDLSGPLEALRIASTHPNHVGASRIYECTVVSVRGGPVITADGVTIVTEPVTVLDGRTIDTLIVPGACNVDDVRRDRELINWVRRRALDCRRVCSVCVGTFLLVLASSYPDLTVEPDAIYVRDGPMWSSAGVTTGIDLALALIEEDCGRTVAMHVARVLVVYLRRMGGQSQYSALLAAQVESASDAFAELERWIAAHLTADLRVESLADRVGMSPRNFARRYTETRKRTPARAVESIRVDAARRTLEETGDRIEDIARRCGFSSEEQLRGVFARHVGISPRAYRDRFAPA
jgi:transcriptional regulator GlxA family with amidase domain